MFCYSTYLFYRYDYTLFVLMYVLPLIILATTYIPISIHLWFHRGLGEVTRAQAQNVQSKRRVSNPILYNYFFECCLK